MNTNIHNCVNALKKEKKIYVENYIGSWSVIDDYMGYILLEHNTYGDETCYLVVEAKNFIWKKYRTILLEEINRPYFNYNDVFETFDGIKECLSDEGII